MPKTGLEPAQGLPPLGPEPSAKTQLHPHRPIWVILRKPRIPLIPPVAQRENEGGLGDFAARKKKASGFDVGTSRWPWNTAVQIVHNFTRDRKAQNPCGAFEVVRGFRYNGLRTSTG